VPHHSGEMSLRLDSKSIQSTWVVAAVLLAAGFVTSVLGGAPAEL